MIQYTIILHCKAHVKSFAPSKYSVLTKSAFCTFSEQNRLKFSIITIHTILRNFFMNTKLNLVQMVDRGSMTPNEWRRVLNLGPIEDGDTPIRRLDTAKVTEGGDE